MLSVRNFRVGTQLIAGFSSAVFLIVCLGGFALYKVKRENTQGAALRDDSLSGVRSNLEMQSAIRGVRESQFLAVGATTPVEPRVAEDPNNTALVRHPRLIATQPPAAKS